MKWGIRQIFDFFLFGVGALGEKHGTIFFKTIYLLFSQKHTLQLVQSGGEWLVVCGKLPPPPGCSYTCTFDTGVSSTKKFLYVNMFLGISYKFYKSKSEI